MLKTKELVEKPGAGREHSPVTGEDATHRADDLKVTKKKRRHEGAIGRVISMNWKLRTRAIASEVWLELGWKMRKQERKSRPSVPGGDMGVLWCVWEESSSALIHF